MTQTVQVKVIARAKRNCVVADGAGFKVYTTTPAIEGRANDAVVEALAEHLGIKRRQVEIIQGLKSRNKLVRINP